MIDQFKPYGLTDKLPQEIADAVEMAKRPFDSKIARDWGLCEILKSYEIDITQEYPEPLYTIRKNGVGTLPRGDIQAIKAKSKNGKSFLSTILTACVLGCGDFGFEAVEEKSKVLYFDTEQNERNTAALARRVYSLMGWSRNKNSERFKAFSLRRAAINERRNVIKEQIEENAPTMAVIDGVADLLDDFNDVAQSNAVINSLMNLSAKYDVAILAVLHTNKRKEDSGMKGHLGTLLLQKSSDVFEVKKEGDIFRVTETDCRNIPVPDFSFTIGADGVPIWQPCLSISREMEKVAKERSRMGKIFSTVADGLTYTELYGKYTIENAVSESTAKSKIRFAKEKNILYADSSGKYFLSKEEII